MMKISPKSRPWRLVNHAAASRAQTDPSQPHAVEYPDGDLSAVKDHQDFSQQRDLAGHGHQDRNRKNIQGIMSALSGHGCRAIEGFLGEGTLLKKGSPPPNPHLPILLDISATLASGQSVCSCQAIPVRYKKKFPVQHPAAIMEGSTSIPRDRRFSQCCSGQHARECLGLWQPNRF